MNPATGTKKLDPVGDQSSQLKEDTTSLLKVKNVEGKRNEP